MSTLYTALSPDPTNRSLASYLPLAGGTLAGNLLSSGFIQGVSFRSDAVNSYDNGYSLLTINSGNGQVSIYGNGARVFVLENDRIQHRNGATSQKFESFHTYTDSSNYQGARLSQSSSLVTLSAITAGTGADDVGITITPAGLGKVAVTSPLTLQGYTVSTLPAGTQGDTAFVTDALAPVFLATIAGGGAVITTVFYNGTNWIAQ